MSVGVHVHHSKIRGSGVKLLLGQSCRGLSRPQAKRYQIVRRTSIANIKRYAPFQVHPRSHWQKYAGHRRKRSGDSIDETESGRLHRSLLAKIDQDCHRCIRTLWSVFIIIVKQDDVLYQHDFQWQSTSWILPERQPEKETISRLA